MSGAVNPTSESVLDRYTPPALQWARDAAQAEAARAQASPSATTPPAVEAAVAGANADRNDALAPRQGSIPARGAEMYVLTSLPAAGGVVPIDRTSGIGRALTQIFQAPPAQPGSPPTTSPWSDANDMRLVLPVLHTQSGPVTGSIETLPGRDQSWATLRIADTPADNRLNFDGLQAGVRVGMGGPMLNQNYLNSTPNTGGLSPTSVDWAEFRLGAEGLVFTGRVVNGSFSVSGFDLENGFFKSKLDGLETWAGQNLPIAIPLGIAAGGVAALAVSQAARLTNQDIALPITITAFERDGWRIRPTLRPVFGTTEFVRFGGAALGIGYEVPGRVSLEVRPGYNNDPTAGGLGWNVGARAMAPVQIPGVGRGVVGAEVQYNQQSGVSAFVGAGITF